MDEQPTRRSNVRPVMLGAVVAIAIVLVAIAVRFDAGHPTYKYAAQRACENEVRDRLEADRLVHFHHTYTHSLGSDFWWDRGVAETQASFGVPVRRVFACRMSTLDGKTWNLIDVRLSPS